MALVGPGMTLTGLQLPAPEIDVVLTAAAAWGVDPRLLGALRKTENGGPGREFGVLNSDATTIDQQAALAAETIRHTMGRYCLTGPAEHPPLVDLATGRLTEAFLSYFSRGGPGYPGYAPLGAANDPGGLNQHHLPNLLAWYGRSELA